MSATDSEQSQSRSEIEITSDVNATQVLPCVHCGEATICEASQDPTSVFCCQGCAGAYQLIHGLGLQDFYALRNQAGTTGNARPARQQSQYERFDRAEYLGTSQPTLCEDGNHTAQLAVQGLHCAACAWLIENALATEAGVVTSRVKLNNHSLRVVYDPQSVRLSKIAKILDSLGYQLAPWKADSRDEPAERESRSLLIRIAIAGFLAANAMWIAIALYAGADATPAYFLRLVGSGLGLVAVLWPGRIFLQGAWAALRTRTPHMDLPVGLGLSVGTIVGTWNAVSGAGHVYFDSMAALVFLLLIGRWLKFRQQQKAAKSVDLMLRLMPQHARRVGLGDAIDEVTVESLKPGDIVEIRTGDSVPADGLLKSVEATNESFARLDCSLLTGESKPVKLEMDGPPAQVYAGSLNVGACLRIEVTAAGPDTRMGSVMQQVEDAAAERVPIVLLADRIGGVFVLAISLLALLTFFMWLGTSLSAATSAATALLIVACPCALALATPLAIATGIGRAAKRGILIRDGSVFQHLATPGQIWLDKTGTLTTGRQHVTTILGDKTYIARAAKLEEKCNHPIALAIIEAARRSQPLEAVEVNDVETHSNGRRGVVDGQVLAVGSLDFIESLGFFLSDSQKAAIEELLVAGQSPCLVAAEGAVQTILGISDPPADGARESLDKLRDFGWKIGVLSGDHHQIVVRVAKSLGIPETECFGSLTPEQKLESIRKSRTSERSTVMVGDGANDAAALAAADVGIAVRGGAEVSLQAAPVLLTTGVSRLAELMRASRRTQWIIGLTFAVSLAYNIIAVSLAMLGLVGPLVAAIFMPISSLSVLAIIIGSPTFDRE